MAVSKVLDGADIKRVAEELGVTNYATIYEWIRKWRTGGDVGLMSKKEQLEAGAYKTRAQLEAALPDDVGELKKLAASLMAEKAVLERDLVGEMLERAVGTLDAAKRAGLKIAKALKGW